MRLTNVAHMALPQGRLFSYSVQAGARVGSHPVSFDQARHVGQGDRPGSWMSVAFRLAESVERDALAEAWHKTVARHSTLRTVFGHSLDGEVSLHEVAVSPGSWEEHDVAPGRLTREVLREVLDATCRPYAEPSHELCVLEPDDRRPVVVVASDHAHVDMWSLLVVVRDLLGFLDAEDPDSVSTVSPLGFEDHTAEMADRPRAPDDVRARWAQVLSASGGAMPGFPLPLGDISRLRPEVVEIRDVLDVGELQRLAAHAQAHGVGMLAVVVAAMTEVNAELAGEPLRAVFPVHSRYDERWHDSVGWFITNSVLESVDPDPSACAVAVKEAMSLGSWPLADIMAPYGGMPVAPGMFALSWLDLARLPVATEPGLEAQFVGAVTETDGVMVWFILNQAGMHLRCRYPDTSEAHDSVGTWLDALAGRLRSTTSRP